MIKLESLRIPRVLRGFDAGEIDVFDLTLDGSVVAEIMPARDPVARGLLISSPVDAHVHIDKAFTVRQVGAADGNLFAAIERMQQHRAHWRAADYDERMERAVREAWLAGTRVMRTHLDWPAAQAPASLASLKALRERWLGRMSLQFVSLTPLDVFANAQDDHQIAAAVRRANGVLGAFVYRNDGLVYKLGRVFELAQEYGLDLDFHVDEGLDADATGLRAIAQLALARGFRRRITCGHACSLSVQDEAQARETLRLCTRAGIALVALPTTNLYLQGAWDSTPVPRGITRLREAAAEGLRPCLATDNVQDAFYPYGSHDLLQVFGLGVQMAHLSPALDWIDTITTSPARALGLAWDGRIAPGCPGDLVRLAAIDEHELLDAHGLRRTVIRGGRPLDEQWPMKEETT